MEGNAEYVFFFFLFNTVGLNSYLTSCEIYDAGPAV